MWGVWHEIRSRRHWEITHSKVMLSACFFFFSYKFHSFALYCSRFWKYIYVYNPFCYVRKNNFFFYVPNILILSRLTNLRVFTNILYDSKERNIINNPHLSVWLNFFVYQWRGLLAAGWNITHRSGNYSSSPTCKHGMTYISPIALQSWRLRHQPGQVRWYTAIYYSTRHVVPQGYPRVLRLSQGQLSFRYICDVTKQQ